MCHHNAILALGFTLMILGGFGFCILASELLPPYVYGGHFPQTTCTVETSYFLGNACCSGELFQSACADPYPCWAVAVSYDDGAAQQKALLVESHWSGQAQQGNLSCSYFRCVHNTDYSARQDDAHSFANSYGPGSTHTCFYNPGRQAEALTSTIGVAAVATSLTLSLILLIVGVAVTVLGYKEICRCADGPAEDQEMFINAVLPSDAEKADKKSSNGTLTVRTTADTDVLTDPED